MQVSGAEEALRLRAVPSSLDPSCPHARARWHRADGGKTARGLDRAEARAAQTGSGVAVLARTFGGVGWLLG